ncbi:MAG: MmgE/PrpD family protein [Burkholderiales bacterium]
MLTKQLAAFVINTRENDVPADVLDGARDALVDTLGCALAGSLDEGSEIAQRWVRETGARAQATVVGTPLATSPAEAAFANGLAAHALDFDDSLTTLRGHPTAPMLGAGLAVGEAAGATGKAVLAAMSIGLEVGGKIGPALGAGHYMKGWHSTATVGVFSATAVAARLWGLTEEQLQTAWGIVASEASGLIRNFGTMTKPFHAGHAARSAVMAAWLAKNGFTADTQIFDGKNNFFSTYAGDDAVALETTLHKLGKPWEMLTPGIYVKRWPCCYCNHRPVGGMFELIQQHNIKLEEVTRVRVGFLPGADTPLIHRDPHTGLEGKFSLEYNAAAALLDGKLTMETFTDAMVQRPEIRAVMPKVERFYIPDEKFYSGVTGYNDIEIVTTRGVFKLHIDRVPGSPAWPMTPADRAEKFLDCAGRVLGSGGAKKLFDVAERTGQLTSITELTRATVPVDTRSAAASVKAAV